MSAMYLSQKQDFRLTLGFLASGLLHALLAMSWGYMASISSDVRPNTATESQRFELENLNQEQIRQIRQVGVRGGHKDGFSAPLPKGNPEKEQQEEKSSPAEKQPGPAGLSLQDLSANQNPPPQQAERKQDQTKQNNEGLSLRNSPQARERIARQQQMIQGDVLSEIGRSSRAQQVIQNTGFNLQFEPPEGIPADELNSVEKIFYSFQRRTFTSYVTTFISNYYEMSHQSSQLKRILQNESHDLTGRVEFNREGQVNSIRIIKGSPRQNVYDLFEKTLKDLKLPNPPKDLLREDGNLVIYYRLKIND